MLLIKKHLTIPAQKKVAEQLAILDALPIEVKKVYEGIITELDSTIANLKEIVARDADKIYRYQISALYESIEQIDRSCEKLVEEQENRSKQYDYRALRARYQHTVRKRWVESGEDEDAFDYLIEELDKLYREYNNFWNSLQKPSYLR